MYFLYCRLETQHSPCQIPPVAQALVPAASRLIGTLRPAPPYKCPHTGTRQSAGTEPGGITIAFPPQHPRKPWLFNHTVTKPSH